jgi:hypothetical protein
MAHTCSPSYLESWDPEDLSSIPMWADSFIFIFIYLFIYLFIFIYLEVLGFKLRASHLLGKHSIA